MSKNLLIALFSCTFLLNTFLFESFSQNSIYFNHISTDDGLSQNDINSIYQDKEGFMWFATHDGLNKYDGYNFTIYNPDRGNPNSINSNLIFTITGDEKGNLWVGTTGSGLNYFDKSLDKFFHFTHDEKNPQSISNNHVSTVYRDKKDRLWVGTPSGISILDLKTSLDSKSFHNINLSEVSRIYEDSKGNIWAGSNEGLHKVLTDHDGNYKVRKINNEINLPDHVSVRGLTEDNFGRLIIGTTWGLYILDLNHPETKVKYITGSSYNCLLAEGYNIWAGTNNGLHLFENLHQGQLPKLKSRFTYNPRNPYGISKDIVKSIYKDKTGIIWVGTNGGGINKIDPDRKQFQHIKKTLDPESLSYDKIRAMFEDSNGTLWVGTEGGGLNMLTKNKDNNLYSGYINFDVPHKPFAITEVQEGDKKKLIIGAEDFPSLYQIDITNPENIKDNDIIRVPASPSNSVFSITEDRYKNLWIGTYRGGIYRWAYYKNSNSYKKDILITNKNNPYSLSNNIIRDILEDKKGNIWFATANGLSKLKPEEALKKDPKFDVFKNVPREENSISHNYILTIYESRAGQLWFGTFGGGLNKYISGKENEDPKFKAYSVSDGLPSNVIKGILEDDEGNLWVSTNQGLSKFNPKEETFKNYDANDGLQSNEFQELACVKRANGEMLFGGVNGFNAFYPKSITDNNIEANTIITKFSISNKEVKIGEEINGRVLLDKAINNIENLELKPSENSFSVEFAALHFAAPGKNKFAYMLEGFDNDWVYTTSNKRFATYTNLESGQYTLKVKASNNDGVWDSVPSELEIYVLPPFWQTNFAYFLYSALIVGLLLMYRRFTIIKTTKKHQLELEHIEKEKNDELNRVKLEFFTNISHEFRTPLTLIKGPLKYLQKHGHEIDRKAANEQYGLMQKNTEYLLRLVNQLLDFRKVNQGKMRLVLRKSNIIHFIKEITEPFQFLAQKQEITFNVNTSQESIESWFDHEALEKIISNLLSNAFKFTSNQGKIGIDISEDEQKHVVIKVIDNGIGIDEEKIKNIFVRFYTDNKSGKKKQRGVGIGLSFTKSLVDLHQGTIDIQSEPNVETVFTVKLPMEKSAYEDIPEITCKEVDDVDFYVRSSETDAAAISINDELIDQNLPSNKSNLPLLLVVDDNADIRTFIKQALSKDYMVYEADNGQMGVELANKIMPSIILTDIVMPEMDGYGLCKNIKNKKETSHIPVIMLTAKLSQESEIEGRKIGADGYIRKPFDIEILELKLSNILKQRSDLRKRFNREISLQPKEVTVTSMDEMFLQKAISIVEDNMMNTDFNVEMLVKEMGYSRSNLYSKFKEITGLSSSEFIRNIKLKRAVQLFEQSDYSVKEIMYMTGFNTASYFAKCFKKQFGVIPSEYVNQNQKKTQSANEDA
ncbi:hybrid sensor histidine kinase/response regulator transcription factor [Seonamhaeicola maritimus]|uniref:histidine kinase n=1 Tax=Seonamhaeicola maritimus TaxID=2591822 RepID=A0A5C7GL91_9FLAO|nr:two-component regulator propeller domain-containing protein [Seonamhaeicola maritimus]TXG39269.1 response regulator [Seonamhaeicola maritimus]